MRLFRIGLLALVAVPFPAVAGGKAAPPPGSCRAPVRDVPLVLPAPLTVRTSCGRFGIARNGVVSRLPDSSLFPRQADTFWQSGVWSGSSHGHLVVGRAHRTLWRSRGRFGHEYEVEVIALDRKALGFTYGLRTPELFVARLGRRERRVARRELPLGWTGAGLYTRRGETLMLRSATGDLRATIARPATHAAYDAADHSVWFVVRGRLFHAEGRRVRPLAQVRTLGLPAGRALHLQPLGHQLVLEDAHQLVVLQQDGSLFVSTRLPQAHHTLVTAEPTATRDGTKVAFVAMRPDHRIETQVMEHGVESLYLLRPRARAAVTVVTRHMWFNVCGHGAKLSWRGHWLLYSASEGSTALIDTRRRRTIGLSSLIRRLPGFKRDDSGSFRVAWG